MRLTTVVPLLAPLLVAALTLQDAVRVWSYPKPRFDCSADVALVMGAAQYDGEPSPALRRRLDRALELFEEGCIDTIIVSGGSRPGDRFSEGEAGVRYLVASGIPRHALAEENRAGTSYQNLILSRPLIDGQAAIIVTDDLHAYRTAWLAARLGLEVQVASVTGHGGRGAYGLRELAILLAYRAGFVR